MCVDVCRPSRADAVCVCVHACVFVRACVDVCRRTLFAPPSASPGPRSQQGSKTCGEEGDREGGGGGRYVPSLADAVCVCACDEGGVKRQGETGRLLRSVGRERQGETERRLGRV